MFLDWSVGIQLCYRCNKVYLFLAVSRCQSQDLTKMVRGVVGL